MYTFLNRHLNNMVSVMNSYLVGVKENPVMKQVDGESCDNVTTETEFIEAFHTNLLEFAKDS